MWVSVIIARYEDQRFTLNLHEKQAYFCNGFTYLSSTQHIIHSVSGNLLRSSETWQTINQEECYHMLNEYWVH